MKVFFTAGCSIVDVIICFPLCLYALAIPLIARLSASLPEAVNIISLGFAFRISAIVCLASVTASPVSFQISVD